MLMLVVVLYAFLITGTLLPKFRSCLASKEEKAGSTIFSIQWMICMSMNCAIPFNEDLSNRAERRTKTEGRPTAIATSLKMTSSHRKHVFMDCATFGLHGCGQQCQGGFVVLKQ